MSELLYVEDMLKLLDRIVPRIDAGGNNPLDETLHHCEYTLYAERERIHSEFSLVLNNLSVPKTITEEQLARLGKITERKCETCKYHIQASHHNDVSAGFVDCRYDPPLITADNRYACLRPLVHKNYWCGRYEADV